MNIISIIIVSIIISISISIIISIIISMQWYDEETDVIKLALNDKQIN